MAKTRKRSGGRGSARGGPAAGPKPTRPRRKTEPARVRPTLAKLDPRLASLVSRTAARGRARPRRVRAARGEEAPAPPALELEFPSPTVPTSVNQIPLAVRSLASHLSTTAMRRLRDFDVVPVLLETTAADGELPRHALEEAQRLTSTTVVARVPRERLVEVATHRGVRRVEASVRLNPAMDLAHGSARLLQGGVRSVAQTGAGVLVGIVDTGIDASHPAFKRVGKTRIVDYLDQVGQTRHSQAQIDAGTAAVSPDQHGHGTHVAGIVAGNGAGMPGQPFAGVAPQADLAVVKTTFDTADIAAAVAHVFELADERQQPCVVNLSLGGHYGGHDGSSLIERVIDELCEGPGCVVVVAAGNEGAARVHAGALLQRGEVEPVRWVADFELTQQLIEGTLMGLLWLQVWTQREDDLTVTLRTPNGELIAPQPGQGTEVDRGKFAVDASHRIAPYSGDNEFTFGVFSVPEPEWLRGWSIIAQEDRSAGRRGVEVGAVHAWIADVEMGAFVSGHSKSHLIGMPGTAFSAITVASYATRRAWGSEETSVPSVLEAITLEDVSYFSSPGPTREEQNKPEVAGPGQWLVSTLSSHASAEAIPPWMRVRGGPYAAMQGTSMATPYICGAVALLLEKEPRLHWAEIKRRLIKSCRTDRFSTPCWNPRWGYGKIDVNRLLLVEPS